jgi:hypothetical protein
LGDAVWVVQCEVHVGRELGTLASLPPHLELQNVVLILGPDCFQYSEWSEECTCAAASTLVVSPYLEVNKLGSGALTPSPPRRALSHTKQPSRLTAHSPLFLAVPNPRCLRPE